MSAIGFVATPGDRPFLGAATVVGAGATAGMVAIVRYVSMLRRRVASVPSAY